MPVAHFHPVASQVFTILVRKHRNAIRESCETEAFNNHTVINAI